MKIIFEPGNVDILVMKARRPIARHVVHNMVVNTGLLAVANLLLGKGRHPAYFAVGAVSAAVAATDTELTGEVHRGVFTQTVVSDRKIRWKFFLQDTEANTAGLVECGVFIGTNWFDPSSLFYNPDPAAAGSPTAVVPRYGGVLFARATFPKIHKDETISISFSWEIPIKII